jgi:hypothetical protein
MIANSTLIDSSLVIGGDKLSFNIDTITVWHAAITLLPFKQTRLRVAIRDSCSVALGLRETLHVLKGPLDSGF